MIFRVVAEALLFLLGVLVFPCRLGVHGLWVGVFVRHVGSKLRTDVGLVPHENRQMFGRRRELGHHLDGAGPGPNNSNRLVGPVDRGIPRS